MPQYTPESLKKLLLESEKLYKDHNAFYLKDAGSALYAVTYEKFKRDVTYLGAALLSLNKRKNTAIFMKNSYEWCCAFIAITALGGTAVPLDIALPANEIYNILDFADVDIIITDEKGLKTLKEEKVKLESFCVISTAQDNIIGELSYNELIKKGERLINNGDTTFDAVVISPEDTAAIIFTSGTTGMTKGVELSHKNLCRDFSLVSEYIKINDSDISMSILPLNHTYELICFLMVIYSGAAISFCQSLRNLKDDFSFYKPTVFVTVPLILEKIDNRFIAQMQKSNGRSMAKLMTKMSTVLPKQGKQKLFSDIHSFFGGRVRMIICGAAALKKETAANFFHYDIPVIMGYGLTECSPIVICNNDSEPTIDSVGKPLPGVEIKINQPDENGIGELCVKGDIVMKGYYKAPDLTESAIINGFFHTGDLGYKDEDGNYHITGRIKNIIVNRSGKNIYPEEIEYYLLSQGAISECMVYSDGDIVAAKIFPNMEQIRRSLNKSTIGSDEAHKAVKEAVRAVNRALPSYKRIKKVSLTDTAFEKTTTHKIKRRS